MEKRAPNRADRRERRILLIFILIAAISLTVWIAVIGIKTGLGSGAERTNPRQAGTERVYDYADMLTDSQQQALEQRISQAEQAIHADIVVVILDESLEEKYPDLYYNSWDETDAYTGIRRYAESFWNENGFGWNKPGDEGNGIIMVDNIYRESNGYVYNWVAGAGDLRYSVGNTACQKLSQAFTDRLPMGDMPQYSDTYADALMEFVADCVRTGGRIHKILSWSAFTPSGVMVAMTSGIIAFIAGAAIFTVLIGRMLWQMNYSGRQRKEKKKKKTAIPWFLIWLLVIFLAGAVPQIAWLPFPVFFIMMFVSMLKPEKKTHAQQAPFTNKEPLEPDEFQITGSRNQYLGNYFVHHSSGSSGGSSGGGFSGGSHGGGGGGFSGGGSHR